MPNSQQTSTDTARIQVAKALITVSMWVAGLAGPGLIAVGVLTSQREVVPVGIGVLFVGVIAVFQHLRSRPEPLAILMLASVNVLILAPTSSRVSHAAILPALTLFAFVGNLAVPPKQARWYSVWCGLGGVAALPWILPGLDLAEFVIGTIMFVAIAGAGWRFIGLAGELLAKEEDVHRSLFERSPVALIEEDFTALGNRLAGLRRRGVTDLTAYLGERPDELQTLISMIVLRRANRAALTMTGVASVDELAVSLSRARKVHELGAFVAQFQAIWDGRQEIAVDLDGTTIEGDRLEAVLHWSAPDGDDGVDLSRVIVAISDVTPRKVIEERLATALEENRNLLEFEHALALCSRSLLMESEEIALEEALTALRQATGAGRAYLTVNVDDPEDGLSFHVARSVSAPESAEDEWMGRVIPWSKYPMVRYELAAGRPFQHVASDEFGSGWRRSVLAVPVFTDGRWAGTVGFVDLGRREPWGDQAVRMLEVAAPMLGTFWERERTRKHLEELIKSKDQFVASVSHELRTPLAAVLGFAEELRDNASSFRAEELAGMLELIADQSQEMADMVEDLLVSARADIGTVSIRAQDVYLRAQAEAVLAGLSSFDGKEIEVVGGRGKVWADPSRTRQIIRNLVTNAIRYGGRRVTIEAVESDEHTVLTVVDDGPGLGSAHWETIFEPYERAHDAPTQPSSIGLGLTVARQLARMMGGDLAYHADEAGSVFTLRLPPGSPEGAPRSANTEVRVASGD